MFDLGLGTPPASKKPADEKKEQSQRKDQDVRVYPHDGWDSTLVAQRAAIEGNRGGAEPEAAKNAESQYSGKTHTKRTIRLVEPEEINGQNGNGGVRAEEPYHVQS